MDPEAARRLLHGADPLADGELLATRLLWIDEAERMRQVLREAGIVCQLRLARPLRAEMGIGPAEPVFETPYSPLRSSWNVVVPSADLARARALVEEALRTDVDGRDDTAERAPRATPVPLVVLPWDEAWDLVEELGRRGIRSAVGAPLGEGSLGERDAPVLVLPDDVERAAMLVPPERS